MLALPALPKHPRFLSMGWAMGVDIPRDALEVAALWLDGVCVHPVCAHIHPTTLRTQRDSAVFVYVCAVLSAVCADVCGSNSLRLNTHGWESCKCLVTTQVQHREGKSLAFVQFLPYIPTLVASTSSQ